MQVFHRMMRILVVFTLFLLSFARLAGAVEPVLDVASVPHLKPEGRENYEVFLLTNLPRAFALSATGAHGWFGGTGTAEEARAKALKACANKGAADCAIYAEDLNVIWHGRAPASTRPQSALLHGNWEYGLTTDDRYFWYGPGTARGVFVWGHGKGSGYDGRAVQAQSYVRAFNNAGFDVVRFVRAPFPDYADAAADTLRQGLAALRAKGWRAIVAGGQSRGAWNSLQMLSSPGLADVAIAVSAASFNSTGGQDAEMSRLLRDARSPQSRVFVVQFRNDIYMPDFAGRTAMFRELLVNRVGALLTVVDPPGFEGHGAGNSVAFARRFGPCMLRFATEKSPTVDCQ
jgi:hypothetical protein